MKNSQLFLMKFKKIHYDTLPTVLVTYRTYNVIAIYVTRPVVTFLWTS
jgi:hypothetical protein